MAITKGILVPEGSKVGDICLVWRGYFLTEDKGKEVQQILNRYVNEELRDRVDLNPEDKFNIEKDITYIEGLAELFD